MTSVTLTDPIPDTTVASGLIATNNSQLRAALNGGIDYANLKGSPSLSAGEVPVWDGSQFVRSSLTRIGVGSLGSGTPDSSKFLSGDGSWKVPPTPATGPAFTYALISNPPASPTTGDYWIAVDSLTAPTYQWMMRWNGSSSNTDKWEFVGGSNLYQEVLTSQSSSLGRYGNLATVGPAITLPRSGVYEITIGASMQGSNDNGGSNTQSIGMSYDIGATGAVIADEISVMAAPSGTVGSTFSSRTKQKTIAVAGTTLTCKYGRGQNGTNSNGNWAERSIAARPVRVS